MEIPRFNTLQEAIDSGYRCVNDETDMDISGVRYVGYTFRNLEGEESVPVWLTDEINRFGWKGCLMPMYPAK